MMNITLPQPQVQALQHPVKDKSNVRNCQDSDEIGDSHHYNRQNKCLGLCELFYDHADYKCHYTATGTQSTITITSSSSLNDCAMIQSFTSTDKDTEKVTTIQPPPLLEKDGSDTNHKDGRKRDRKKLSNLPSTTIVAIVITVLGMVGILVVYSVINNGRTRKNRYGMVYPMDDPTIDNNDDTTVDGNIRTTSPKNQCAVVHKMTELSSSSSANNNNVLKKGYFDLQRVPQENLQRGRIGRT